MVTGDLDWKSLGNCLGVDPHIFFPERGGSTKSAKLICHTCPAKEECLEYALDQGIKHGIWGGLSEKERRRIRRLRRLSGQYPDNSSTWLEDY